MGHYQRKILYPGTFSGAHQLVSLQEENTTGFEMDTCSSNTMYLISGLVFTTHAIDADVIPVVSS